MNELGIQKFLEKAQIGMEIMCSTSEHSYHGTIEKLYDTWMVIQGEPTGWVVDYGDIYWHSLEGE